VAAILSACSNAASDSKASLPSDTVTIEAPPSMDTPTTTLPAAPHGGLVVPECDDVELGSCAAGFVLDGGIFYDLGCAAIRNSAVSDEVIGRDELESETVTINTIEEVSSTVMVAVSLPGGLCAESDRALSDWSMAFPQGADGETLLQAICAVGELSPTQREANDC
jgi:hypothetical protein